MICEHDTREVCFVFSRRLPIREQGVPITIGGKKK